MKQLIDKDILVEEIYRLSSHLDSLREQRIIEKILSIIDTLEVKNIDLNKEVHKFIDNEELHLRLWDVDRIAKHFFELGLKAQKGE